MPVVQGSFNLLYSIPLQQIINDCYKTLPVKYYEKENYQKLINDAYSKIGLSLLTCRRLEGVLFLTETKEGLVPYGWSADDI